MYIPIKIPNAINVTIAITTEVTAITAASTNFH